jgi:hypothetical protein
MLTNSIDVIEAILGDSTSSGDRDEQILHGRLRGLSVSLFPDIAQTRLEFGVHPDEKGGFEIRSPPNRITKSPTVGVAVGWFFPELIFEQACRRRCDFEFEPDRIKAIDPDVSLHFQPTDSEWARVKASK